MMHMTIYQSRPDCMVVVATRHSGCVGPHRYLSVPTRGTSRYLPNLVEFFSKFLDGLFHLGFEAR